MSATADRSIYYCPLCPYSNNDIKCGVVKRTNGSNRCDIDSTSICRGVVSDKAFISVPLGDYRQWI